MISPNTSARHTFVLVHGAWHGGWCWRRVADILELSGHKVFTPTLTGLADRSHLLSGDINLDTHVNDVSNLFEWENIDDAILCGHSYAGWVISGAVERIEPRVSSLIFLDAYIPENGQMGVETSKRKEAMHAAKARGAIALNPPEGETFNVRDERDRQWVAAKLTAQPLGVSFQRIQLAGARNRIKNKTYVRARRYDNPAFDRFYQSTSADPVWHALEVDCGHDVMIDEPKWLAEVLIQSASRARV